MLISEIAEMIIQEIRKMSPKEKALLRIQLQKGFGLPPRPEPDAYEN